MKIFWEIHDSELVKAYRSPNEIDLLIEPAMIYLNENDFGQPSEPLQQSVVIKLVGLVDTGSVDLIQQGQRLHGGRVFVGDQTIDDIIPLPLKFMGTCGISLNLWASNAELTVKGTQISIERIDQHSKIN